MRKIVLLLASMSMAVLLASGVALAAKLTVKDATVRIVDEAGEPNFIDVVQEGDTVTIRDEDSPFTFGQLPQACEKVSENTVRCMTDALDRIRADLGGGDDAILPFGRHEDQGLPLRREWT